MRQLDSDSPFFKADLYKKYFTLDYTQFLTGNEKSWLEEHGGIRIGFLNNDPIVFSMDKRVERFVVHCLNMFRMPKIVWEIIH